MENHLPHHKRWRFLSQQAVLSQHSCKMIPKAIVSLLKCSRNKEQTCTLTLASLTVQVVSPSTYPPLIWPIYDSNLNQYPTTEPIHINLQSPGPAVGVSWMPICIGIGTSTKPFANRPNACSTALMISTDGFKLETIVLYSNNFGGDGPAVELCLFINLETFKQFEWFLSSVDADFIVITPYWGLIWDSWYTELPGSRLNDGFE